jgi:hypothetical protein
MILSSLRRFFWYFGHSNAKVTNTPRVPAKQRPDWREDFLELCMQLPHPLLKLALEHSDKLAPEVISIPSSCPSSSSQQLITATGCSEGGQGEKGESSLSRLACTQI